MGRIVAIGGGDLLSTEKINEYAIRLTKSECPNLLFIGTASNDAEEYIEKIQKIFNKYNCITKDLSLTKREYTEGEIDSLIKWADIIYVGGGDTRYMMDIWKLYNLDQKLKHIYSDDSAVLMGISAGAICWFECGHSDSEAFTGKKDWEYIFVDNMLSIFPYALCPHYNETGRESFDMMLAGRNIPGIALENNTAFVDNNGMKFFMRSDKEAEAYIITNVDGVISKESVEFVQE